MLIYSPHVCPRRQLARFFNKDAAMNWVMSWREGLFCPSENRENVRPLETKSLMHANNCPLLVSLRIRSKLSRCGESFLDIV